MQNTQTGSTDSRQKYWCELSADEKIERMREIVKHLQNQFGYVSGQIMALRNDFENHNHINNEVVRPLKLINFGLAGSATGSATNAINSKAMEAEAKGEVYF